MSEARHQFLVFSNPVAGQEEVYHAWYRRHIAEILRLAPFLSAQQLELHPTAGRLGPGRRYLVTYETAGAPEEAVATLQRAVAEGRVTPPDAAWVEIPLLSFFVTPTGPLITG